MPKLTEKEFARLLAHLSYTHGLAAALMRQCELSLARCLSFTTTEGRRLMDAGISEPARELLDLRLRQAAAGGNRVGWLLVGSQGRRVNGSTLQKAFARAAIKAKITKPVNPRALAS